jgi:transposase
MKLDILLLLKWVQGTTRISPAGLTPDEAKALKKQLKEKDEELLILKKHSACWQRNRNH